MFEFLVVFHLATVQVELTLFGGWGGRLLVHGGGGRHAASDSQKNGLLYGVMDVDQKWSKTSARLFG